MYIGCIGEVIFEISNETIQTVNSFSWSSGGDWSEHKLVGGLVIPEFNGTELDVISIQIYLSEYLGADPISEFEKLRQYARDGEVIEFELGEQIYGEEWIVRSVKCNAEHFDTKGNISSMEVSITLSEYN